MKVHVQHLIVKLPRKKNHEHNEQLMLRDREQDNWQLTGVVRTDSEWRYYFTRSVVTEEP